MRRKHRSTGFHGRRTVAVEPLENRHLLSGDLWARVGSDSQDGNASADSAFYHVDHAGLLRAVESAPIAGSLGPVEPPSLRPDRVPGRARLPIAGDVLQEFRWVRHLVQADHDAGGFSEVGTFSGEGGGFRVELVVGPSTLLAHGQSIDDSSTRFQILPTLSASSDGLSQVRLAWTDQPAGVMPPPSIESVAAEAAALQPDATIPPAAVTACSSFENFDTAFLYNLPIGWTTSFSGGNAWQTFDLFSDSLPNHAVVPTPPFPSDNTLTSPVFTLSPSSTQLSFRTAYEMQPTSHGGVLEISIDGSPFVDVLDAGGRFVTGGYDATLAAANNPLSGRQTWTGQFRDYKDTVVDLPSVAVGQPIQLRWRMATNGDFFNGGWRVDTISLCAPQASMDYGDAPDPSYPTLQSSNGASHVVGGPLYLGSAVDAELDGQPDPAAMGDDQSGSDDDDGVLLPPYLRPGQTADVTVIASVAGGRLNAWVDFNDDGDWSDTGEQIFSDRILNAGPNQLSFFVPHHATGSATTQLRFRVSTQANLSFDGAADDGEVEDYALATAIQVLQVDTLDRLDDGNVSPGNVSLREAIRMSNQQFGYDLITFSPALAGGTIVAIENGFTVTDDVSIVGLGADQLTLSGNNQVRVFDLSSNADVTISDVTIADGRVIGSGRTGGGIRSLGNLRLQRSVVRNSVSDSGGGIYQVNGTLVVSDSTISQNTSQSGDGGGIRADDAVVVIERSDVSDNVATTSITGYRAYGGGIAMRSGDLTITDSTLDGNQANGSGGGFIADSSLQMAGSTISNNTAVLDGGGFAWGSPTETAEIVNSTISGNNVTNGIGGAITAFGGPMNVSHSTITNNSSGFVGGIVTILGSPTAPVVTLASSIVAGNQQVDLHNQSGSGMILSGGYNLIGISQTDAVFDQPGDQIWVQDPGLAPLQDNGGPTKTHAPYNNSPALNQGDPAASAGIAAVPLHDQRGNGYTRVDDGRIDIGAFEGFQARAPQVEHITIGSRSVLSYVAIFFDSPIDVTSPSAFKITNRDTHQILDSVRYSVHTQPGPNGNVSTVSLLFDPGVSVDTMLNSQNSLADGNYLLEIDPALIKSQEFDLFMESPLTFGDEEADRFFRLFGDRDGDRDVDGQDYQRFGQTFMKSVGEPGYDIQFDSDGDGDVDAQDYGRFGLRMLKRLPF
ncbi:hypothetical protein Enr13x_00590 [Stieleria neptunia]|uniref:GEVED domain-containing protein n=1 Tax=Stieleria neptunia TaxID=2527979 RepID=A0A518HHD1_9BACT|nr:choice-of-anchor Q domain-containing protein [Stieleria neptunia]QDV40253.1 hypothetical protein Enr13x_00590 [Stieleria neptunia]